MRSQHYENRHPNPKSNPYYRHFTKSLITQIYCNIIQASAYIAMTCVIHSADNNITILKPEFTCTQCSNGCQCVLCNFQWFMFNIV